MRNALAVCVVLLAGCGGDGDAPPAGPIECTAPLPTANVYDGCTPVDPSVVGCLGSNHAGQITYPSCDMAYGVPFSCTCQQLGSGEPDWYCPV
jgi:hypothetical protein